MSCLPRSELGQVLLRDISYKGMKNNALSQILFWGIVVILLLPLLNIPPWFSPPDWGKSMAFRILFSLSIFLALWILLLQRERANVASEIMTRWKGARLVIWLLLLLFLWFFTASVLSSDPSFAFWGNPSRGGGFINFASLILFAIFIFLFARKEQWNTLWKTSLVIGILVSIVAVFQWQGLFSNLFISQEGGRPRSTMGNDIQLAMYLLLLLFPAIAFALQKENLKKKLLFLLPALLFVFALALTGSRGGYLGLATGLAFFLFFFPTEHYRRRLAFKLIFLLLMLLPAWAIYFTNVQYPNLDREGQKAIDRNRALSTILGRFSLAQIWTQEARFGAWRVGIEAIKDKPLLGWGMEHFAVAFDKHYDPTIPNIQYLPGSANSWWDRAHNFFIDIAAQAGLGGLGLFLTLIGVLIWQLQKVKQNTSLRLLAHGTQASFVGWFAATLFGFDTFSTYLVLFFLIAYAMHLLFENTSLKAVQPVRWQRLSQGLRIGFVCITGAVLLFFIWQYALKPMQVNAHILVGLRLGEKQNPCSTSVISMEQALKAGPTFLDGYARARYFDMLRSCNQVQGATSLQIATKSYQLMESAAKFWPYHTRNWIFLGQLANVLMERAEAEGGLSKENREALIANSHAAFQKAADLSPKHQEIYIEWTKTFLVAKDFKGAKEKAKECVAIDSRTGDCWWLQGLAEAYLGQTKDSTSHIARAERSGFNTNTFYALSQLAKLYTVQKDFVNLAETYEKLILLKPKEPQLYASLAAVYKELGQCQNAKNTALKVLELAKEQKNQEMEAETEVFLSTLPCY